MKIASKVVSLEDLVNIVGKLRKSGKRIVHCHGVFDLLHPGHLLHFQAAKQQGDILVVTLTPDHYVGKGPGRPVFNHRLRAESVAALTHVDYVAVNDQPTAVTLIQRLKPDIYAKGSDYKNAEDDLTGKITEEEMAVNSVGGRLHFTNELSFSSTELLNRHYMVYPDQAQSFLESFRKNYSVDSVIQKLKSLQSLKVLIIGEAIIDEYHYCEPMGKSPKESIVASRYLHEEIFPGGVLACANHAAGFCNQVNLVTQLGTAEQSHFEPFVRNALKPQVQPTLFFRKDAPTIVKRRFVWQPFMTKLFEIAFLSDQPTPKTLEKNMLKTLSKLVAKADVVIAVDYGHGFFTPTLIDFLTKKSKFFAVNVQTNSANTGFNTLSKYPHADYVCIDEREMRIEHKDKFTDLHALIEKTASRMKARYVTVTHGHHGSVVYAKGKGFFQTPIFSKEIVDRVGAGDAFLAVTAPCAAKGFPPELIGFIGNTVGALAVKIVGNRNAVEPIPLFKFITALLK
ncbi:MAG TPA: PfkB family carbohydrate kinase [Candidatus Paceibacterota bacterium]